MTPDRHCPRLGFGGLSLCALCSGPDPHTSSSGPTPGGSLARAPSSKASDGAFQCGFSMAPAPLSRGTAVTICLVKRMAVPGEEAGDFPGGPEIDPKTLDPDKDTGQPALPLGCREGRGTVLLSPVAPLGSLCPWHLALPRGCAPTACSQWRPQRSLQRGREGGWVFNALSLCLQGPLRSRPGEVVPSTAP